MGQHNAQEAALLAAQRGLGHRAARMFMWMGLSSLDQEGRDDHPPRVYYKGREDLAIGIGYAAPQNGTPAAFTAVKRAIKELVDAGLVTCLEEGAYNRHSKYQLNVPAKPRLQKSADESPASF